MTTEPLDAPTVLQAVYDSLEVCVRQLSALATATDAQGAHSEAAGIAWAAQVVGVAVSGLTSALQEVAIAGETAGLDADLRRLLGEEGEE